MDNCKIKNNSHFLPKKFLGLFEKYYKSPVREKENVELYKVLMDVKKFCTSSSTPKSRVNLVYNFGEEVDVIISFAHYDCKENFFRLSKGISKLFNSRTLKKEQLDERTKNCINLPLRQCVLPFEKCILLLETKNTIRGFKDWTSILDELDTWAASNYPLIIGVDIYTMPGYLDFPALDVLNTVLKQKNLNFVFYNKGYRNLDFLHIPKTKKPNPSGYILPKTQNEFYINSMIELRNVLLNADSANATKYRHILQSALSPTNRASATAISLIRSRNINLFNNNTQKYLVETNKYYRMGYSLQDGYVHFSSLEQKFLTTDKYILVTENTELMLNAELTEVLSEIQLYDCKMPEITFVEGCPGSGKSHYIIQNHQPGNDLILTHTREAVRDIRKAVARSFRVSEKSLLQDYRTVSSFIINQRGKRYNRVFVDEVSLGHAGYIGFIAFLTGAKDFFLLGDTKQIPYIERSPVKVQFHDVTNFCRPKVYLMTTKRCPIDVTYALAQLYSEITTRNEILRSISPSLTNGEFYQIKPGTLLLTFTQAEKERLVRNLAGKCRDELQVCTVHESQGKTAEHVLLCRINPKPLAVYNSLPHAVVALSRHTKSFQYITTNSNDTVSKLIKRGQQLNEKKLKNWHEDRLLRARDTKYSESLIPNKRPDLPARPENG